MVRRPARARKTAEKAAKKPAPKPAKGASGKTAEATEERIVDAALTLAGERGWRSISLADIAEAAGLSLAALYTVLPSKGAILEAFARRIDRATLAGLEPAAESEDSVRDRLFEIIMRSFDALEPHKRGVAALLADLPRSPLALLCQGTRLLRSLSWIAAAAGVETGGPLGLLRVKALGTAYVWVLRTWLGDDTQDKARTMEALDRALKNLEMLATSLPHLCRARGEP
jgi:AcrR family transcriptional regulator